MWSKVESYIKKNKLLKPNQLYIVALSGGADSVALLLGLNEAGYQVHAAHCNFRLRGSESDRDEMFCERLCNEKNIPFHRVHFDTRSHAELHHVSIEMAARELRYHWFSQLAQDLGAEGVCVAHHQEDSAETVLLNLIRGTGVRGLTGILPKTVLHGQQADTSICIIRPLLCVSRAEIEDFLAARKQAYVTDSTNLETDYQRNKIRLEVLPLLKTLNPAVIEQILLTSENVAEAQKVLDALNQEFKSSNELKFKDINKYSSSEYLAFEWLKDYGFNGPQVRQILEAETGSVISSSLGYDVAKDRDRLVVEPSLKPQKTLRIPEPGQYVIEDHLKLCFSMVDPYVSKQADIATLDAAKVSFPLTVRRVETGDIMQPYGMKGRKLLSDFMTDRKLNILEKRRQLVVVDGHGIIVWVVGLRIDQRVAVTPETRSVLEIRKL